MNRGSAARNDRHADLADSFNEAPIHESGKCEEHEQDVKVRVASMRPRFMNRGSAAKATGAGRIGLLQ